MSHPFFDHPILNSPYECPARHWEIDKEGQPTQRTLETRRPAKFITPIPKPKKRKSTARQDDFVFDDGAGLSTQEQQYDPTSIIGVNHLGTYGRWAFAEFTEMYRIEADFKAKVESAFNKMIEGVAHEN